MKNAVVLCSLSTVLLTGVVTSFSYGHTEAQYCLLVFGPEGRVQIWVTVEDERISLDRQDSGERQSGLLRSATLSDCKDLEIADPDGQTRYIITRVTSQRDDLHSRHSLVVHADIRGPLAYRQYADVELMQQRSQARVAHFHGPLTVGPRTIYWKLPPDLALTTGDEPTDLPGVVGTMDAERGCWVVVDTQQDGDQSAFPSGITPIVDIEFPPAEPGGAPVKRRYSLDKFC